MELAATQSVFASTTLRLDDVVSTEIVGRGAMRLHGTTAWRDQTDRMELPVRRDWLYLEEGIR